MWDEGNGPFKGLIESDAAYQKFYDPTSSNGLGKGPNLLLNTTGFWLSVAGGGAAAFGLSRGLTFWKLSYAIADIGVNSIGAISSLNSMTGSFTGNGSNVWWNNGALDAGIGLTGAWNSRYNGFSSFRINNAATIGLNLFSIGLGVYHNYNVK